MRDLVLTKTLGCEVVKEEGQYPGRLEFISHSTVLKYNAGVVKVDQKHNLYFMTIGSKRISVKYPWFLGKITCGECSVKKVDGKDQKSDIFTTGFQGKIFCGY